MRNLDRSKSAFHDFSDEDREAIYAAGTMRDYTPGEVIIHQGDTGDSMYVIVEGEAQVVFDDDRPSKSIGTGSFFGELAFINPDHKRSATILAGEGCRLCVLGPEAGDLLIERFPRAFVTLLRRTCASLVDAEEALIANLREKNRKLEQTLDWLLKTREELDHQEMLAQTDELTGLYNRRCMMSHLERLVARGEETGSFALIMIDLDKFKLVNDTLGHAAGDKVLTNVAEVLRKSIRRTDLACRLGGDEFAVVLTSIAPVDAGRRGDHLLEKLGALPPPDRRRPEINVSASIGGAMYQAPETIAALLERADTDLYAAKDAGRNCFVWQGEMRPAPASKEPGR